jgi:hypothetical protein
MTTDSLELLQRTRAELAPTEEPNRFVELITQGRLPVARVRDLVCEELRINIADRRSFALLASRFPLSPSADFFLYLAGSETPGREGLLRLGGELGLTDDDVAAYEPKPGCQTYPAYLSQLALGGSQADVALALVANMAAFGEACLATATALVEHYGISKEAVQFFAIFGEPNPEFEALALSVVEDGLVGGKPATSARTAARLIQVYELQFWNTLAEGID